MPNIEPRGCPTPGACSCPSDRLIAAAPRMLDSIRGMVRQIEEASAVETGGYYIPGPQERMWYDAARAILRDVEG